MMVEGMNQRNIIMITEDKRNSQWWKKNRWMKKREKREKFERLFVQREIFLSVDY